MIRYVCKGSDGKAFIASEELAEVLTWATAARLAGNNGCVKVHVTDLGRARIATAGNHRIIAYAAGGYGRFVHRSAGWGIARELPAEVEEALCLALGIEVARDWTVEEILAQEG